MEDNNFDITKNAKMYSKFSTSSDKSETQYQKVEKIPWCIPHYFVPVRKIEKLFVNKIIFVVGKATFTLICNIIFNF